MHGRSLRPVSLGDGDASGWRTTLVGEYHYHGPDRFFPRRAITDGRYKLIRNLEAGERTAGGHVDGDGSFGVAVRRPEGDAIREAYERLVDPPEWELYDLQADPIEFDNRADDPELADVRSRLQTALDEWQRATDDPYVDAAYRDRIAERFAQ